MQRKMLMASVRFGAIIALVAAVVDTLVTLLLPDHHHWMGLLGKTIILAITFSIVYFVLYILPLDTFLSFVRKKEEKGDYCVDFSERIELQGLGPLFRSLGESLNERLAEADETIAQTYCSASRLIPMSEGIRDTQNSMAQSAIINAKNAERIVEDMA